LTDQAPSLTGGRVLVLGASGMLGHTLIDVLSGRPGLDVHGTVRDPEPPAALRTGTTATAIHPGVDVARSGALDALLDVVRPDVIVNAVGIVKQAAVIDDPIDTIELNALLPHRLARLAAARGARLIHISTDCVFSGRRGGYTEEDTPDPVDRYGLTKLLGEVVHGDALTIRTSIVGHELATRHGLVDWFLAEAGTVPGYRRAVFSGLPTVELARVIADEVLPRPALRGLLHVAAAPIAKLDFLALVAERYAAPATLEPRDEPVIDRSLDAGRFADATGYRAPAWPDLVAAMHDDAVARYGGRFRASVPARVAPPSR
jgi:dTDP-4-dehydrorhamnose reductase